MYNVNMQNKLCENLKALRIARGLTQQQLANELNLSRVNYTRYETGASNPDYDTLIKIADYYDVSLDSLFNRKEY